MMEEKLNEFDMLLTGRCFLCLTQPLVTPIKLQRIKLEEAGSKSESNLTHSIQCLSHYLRVNMELEKLLNDDDGFGLYYTPSQTFSTADIERLTKAKVDLCESCASLNESFSALYHELEKIQMKVTHSLRLIHAKLASAGEAASPEEVSDELEGDHDNDGMFRKLRVFNKLRKVMMEKSSEKLSKISPQLILPKIYPGASNKLKTKQRSKSRMKKGARSKVPPQDSSPQLDTIIKTEADYMPELNNMDDPDDDRDSYFGGAVAEDETEPDPANNDLHEQQQSAMDIEVETSSQKPYLIILPSKSATGEEEDDSPQSVFNPETMKHKCFRCPKQFASSQGAAVHFRTNHLQIRYKCKDCGKIYRDQSHCVGHHKRVHTGNQHKCPVCNLVYGSKELLRKHKMQSLHMSRYYCPEPSSGTTSTEANLKTEPDNETDGDAQGMEEEESDPLDQIAARRTDAETLQEEERLRRLNSTTGKYECLECPVEYTSRGGFRNHFESVHLQIRFKCSTCGKDFRFRGGYIRHKMTQHMGVKFPCLKCNRTFTKERSLKIHQQTTSCNDSGTPQVDKVCCDICGKAFARISYLRGHYKEIHLKQGGGVICDVCGKSFKRKENLTRHRKKAHPNQS